MRKLAAAWIVTTHLLLGGEMRSAAAEPKAAVQDRFQLLPPGSVRLEGSIQARIQQQSGLSFDARTLAAMADVFRKRQNGFADGEFWGKCVRSLCHSYQYTADPHLKAMLDETLADLLSTQTPDGAITGYRPDKQPYDTDVWDRKYALLGLINGYESTRDPRVLEACRKMADHLLAQVGPPPKVRVYDTHYGSRPNFPQNPSLREICFAGIESSSILEPMVRLYRLTGEPRYLEFCRYLVEVEGGSLRGSIFEAALAGRDAKDFGGDGDPNHSVAHAYSVISCFEGLLEYYRFSGDPRWKQAAENLYENVLAKELAIIGSCCGYGKVSKGIAPTEQFNHTAFYQTAPVIDGLEGCTHARWMAFCRQLLLLTGEARFADQFERTLYNAFLGGIRPDGEAVDYHTQLNGTRPAKVNYHKVFNGKDITCCYYNVMDTLALIPTVAVLSSEGGPVVNLYIPGSTKVHLADGNEVVLEQATDYPKSGEIAIKVNPAKAARFPVRVRIPAWSVKTSVTVNGKAVEAKPGAYLCMDRKWSTGDTIALSLDMRCRLVRPPAGTPEDASAFQALLRGPIVLARDKRLGGNIHEDVDIQADAEGYVKLTAMTSTIPALVQFTVPTVRGGTFPVIDFATSGNTWDAQSERVTWIPRVSPPSARWIWFPDAGNPGENAPVGKRWFRRVLEIPAGREIKQATATVCADNEFTLFVGGRRVGSGSTWQKPVQMDIRPDLKPGPLVLAIEAANTVFTGPNPAGLLGCVQVEFTAGPPLIHFTDGSWKTCDQELAGWQTLGFKDADWKSARVLGRSDMQPWGALAELAWAKQVPARVLQPFLRDVATGYLLQYSFMSPRPYCWKNDETVLLSGWEVDKSGGHLEYQPTCRYPDGFAFHSDWFKLVDTSTNAALTLKHQVARQTEGLVTLEFRFKLPAVQDGAAWQLRDLERAGVSIVTSGGNLCWESGTVLMPYETNREYGVKVVADITAKKASVSVDGEVKARDFPFAHPIESIDFFLARTGAAATGEMFLSPVNLCKGYEVNETFVTCGVGKTPADWEVKGGGVRPFECGTKPDIFSLHVTGEATRPIRTWTGKTVFACKFLLPDKADRLSINLGGVELSGVVPYRSNLWYMAKVVADPATRTAAVTINGKPLPDKVRFPEAGKFIRFAGALWVDDVEVYPWRDYPADYVPEPKPVSASHLLGVQSCNLWREGTAYAGWDYVYPHADKRKPYLGWYDEGNPEETDWEIKWQVEHGIGFELHCWYRPNNAINHPIKDGVLDQGIIKGLFNARYSNLKKFAIMCTNEGACETNPQDWRDNVIPYWIEYFFKDPRYLKIDGKPVLSIYHLGNLLRMFGGNEGARQAIQTLRDEAATAGFPGLVLLMELRNADRNTMRTMKAIGVDYCYAYTWGTPDVNAQRRNNIAQRDAAATEQLGVLPSISMGWDREAWGVHDGGWVPTSDYRALLQWARDDLLPSHPADSLGRRIVMLPNWNEFGEGHFLLPAASVGFGYLDALRSVFTAGGPHADGEPTDQQKHRFTVLYPRE